MKLDDESLKRAEAALEKSKKRKHNSYKESTKENGPKVSFYSEYQKKLKLVFESIRPQWLTSFSSITGPLGKRIIGAYVGFYKKISYKKSEAGDMVLSPKRSFIAILLLGIFTLFVPFIFFKHIIPGSFNLAYDAVMLSFSKDDSLYLGRIELVDDKKQIYQVMGCRDIRECDGGENTTYFRLRPNMILGLKYWATKFEPYDPAEIGGAMVSELNNCEIVYYGRRVKAFGWYPYITAARCKPVGPTG